MFGMQLQGACVRVRGGEGQHLMSEPLPAKGATASVLGRGVVIAVSRVVPDFAFVQIGGDVRGTLTEYLIPAKLPRRTQGSSYPGGQDQRHFDEIEAALE
jgi:hypothetical protein